MVHTIQKTNSLLSVSETQEKTILISIEGIHKETEQEIILTPKNLEDLIGTLLHIQSKIRKG